MGDGQDPWPSYDPPFRSLSPATYLRNNMVRYNGLPQLRNVESRMVVRSPAVRGSCLPSTCFRCCNVHIIHDLLRTNSRSVCPCTSAPYLCWCACTLRWYAAGGSPADHVFTPSMLLQSQNTGIHERLLLPCSDTPNADTGTTAVLTCA